MVKNLNGKYACNVIHAIEGTVNEITWDYDLKKYFIDATNIR